MRLDDDQFAALVAELRTRIPVHAPEWTDHNESDPGIALLEVLAFLSEQLAERADRLPERGRSSLDRTLRALLALRGRERGKNTE